MKPLNARARVATAGVALLSRIDIFARRQNVTSVRRRHVVLQHLSLPGHQLASVLVPFEIASKVLDLRFVDVVGGAVVEAHGRLRRPRHERQLLSVFTSLVVLQRKIK